MIFLFLFFAAMGYIMIGALLSLHWVKESIENASGNWNVDAYLIRCCVKWPFMIFYKDLR